MNETQEKILLRKASDSLGMWIYRNLQLVENLDSERLNWADTYLKNVEDGIRETKELLSGILLPAEKCKWTADLDTDNACFSTDCGDGFWFQSGVDDFYKFCKFCIFCGKEIEFCLEDPEDDEPEAA